jgi:NodT family efflux transporter outer membrane factor (OMF) lipoprotein
MTSSLDQRREAGQAAQRRRAVAVTVAAAGCLLLSACAAGPNFKAPAPPSVTSYTARDPSTTVATPGVAGGAAQRFDAADIPGDWWTLFHSPALNGLVETALRNNHDLKAAQAALAAAQETAYASRGAFFPSVTAGYSATRQRQSGALAPTPSSNATQFNLFTPQVSVSYTLDVFGLNRRTAEAAEAQAQASRFQMLAAHLTLTSNVVVAAIQLASLEDQIAATHALIDADSKIVEILRDQQQKGYASGLDLAAQQSQLAQAQATLPPLLKQAAQQHDLLAVLTGQYPSQAPAQTFDLASLTLPTDLPASLPSRLVEQRPDVGQAEANLHAASAQVGIAAANRLPNIQLTAVGGTTGLSFANTFGPGEAFWSLGAALTAPIFEGGTLRHQERAARDAYRQSAEQYRSTVLGAFQNVADTLTAIDQDARALKATSAAADAAKATLDLSERQWKAGYASYLPLLNAEQAYQQARIALVQAQAARYADTAALYQALGGGWWRRPDLAKDTR